MSEIVFLQSIFPDVPLGQIEAVLEQANGDLELSIERLGIEVDPDQVNVLQELFPNTGVDVLAATLQTHSNLDDAIHSLLPLEQAETSRTLLILPPKALRDKLENAKAYQAKETLSVQVEFLSNMFPALKVSAIDEALLMTRGDVASAMDTLTRWTSSQNVHSNDTDSNLAILMEMYPNESLQSLQSCLLKNRTLEATIDELTSIDKSAWDQKLSVPSIGLTYTTSKEEIPKELPKIQSTKVKSTSETEWRSIASDLAERRNELFSKASQEINRGQLRGGAAAYYAQEAHQLDAKMRDANERAAALIIKKNEVAHGSDPSVIDVHGLTVQEATGRMDTLIADMPKLRRALGKQSPKIQIITGAGLHSQNNAPKLYPALIKYFLNAGWGVSRGDSIGSFWVQLRV